MTDINKMSIGFFQASSSWVVFPEYVEFYTSEDGIAFDKGLEELMRFLH